MSDTVYAIASGKGGVGKTTTAINLGAMLAERDHSVVVVDTDLGMANLAGFLDFEVEDPTLHEVLAGEASPDEAISEAPGGIEVLPSGTDIEAFAKSNPAELGGVVAALREEYDYVLLDTGAGVSYDSLVPLALADAVLLVATPDVASVRDTAKTGELAERVESEVAGGVLTKRGNDILNADDVEETLGTEILAVVPSDEAVPMGIDAGRPLAAFAPNAPAGQAYRDLAAVLIGDADPDPELDLGDDADADDAERVTPETLTEGVESPSKDSFAGAEIAENVRDAVGDGDSGGLLGGELSKAADEIRAEAVGDAGGESSEAGEEAATTESPGDSAAGPSDESPESVADQTDEARSVDDLIEEHIGDDRFGEEPDSSESDDPLAEGADEASEADGADEIDRTDEPGAESTDSDDDPLGGTEDGDAGGVEISNDGDLANEPERGEDGVEASDAVPFKDDRSADDGPIGTELAGAGPNTGVTDGKDDSADPQSAERSDDGNASTGGDDSSDSSDRSDGNGEGENGGVLSRLGSLFR